MLRSLYIENIAVARQLSLEFREGFTVLTGETGAGKSVIIDCLSLITGGKSQREMIRSGCDRAVVSAVFDSLPPCPVLAENGITPDENGEIEIVRTLTSDGRSSVKINRRTVPLTLLRDIGGYLISIQSQSEARNLLDKSFHMDMLDEFAGADALLAAYTPLYARLGELNAAAATLRESLKQKSMLTEILRYQIKEIDAAKLSDPEEEEKLAATRLRLKDIERIAKYSMFVYRALAQSEKGASASLLIQKSAAALRQLAEVMPEAEALAAKLDNYRYEIEDIGETARALTDADSGEDPEKRLNAIEARLTLIKKLERKYGADISEILEFRRKSAAQLADILSGDEKLDELDAQIRAVRSELTVHAAAISDCRREAGERLSRSVSDTLTYLDMPKVRFVTAVQKMYSGPDEQFGPRGSDDVSFMIATNPGEPPMPLGKIASGGEMSRVMLALRSVMNAKSGAQTVVFDEIDAGVSGGTSERIGLKLREIAGKVQVLSVTHSPQIAALADAHLKIEKHETDGRVESRVIELDADGRVAEIARIIGGIDVTETQREAAREMVEKQ